MIVVQCMWSCETWVTTGLKHRNTCWPYPRHTSSYFYFFHLIFFFKLAYNLSLQYLKLQQNYMNTKSYKRLKFKQRLQIMKNSEKQTKKWKRKTKEKRKKTKNKTKTQNKYSQNKTKGKRERERLRKKLPPPIHPIFPNGFLHVVYLFVHWNLLSVIRLLYLNYVIW